MTQGRDDPDPFFRSKWLCVETYVWLQ